MRKTRQYKATSGIEIAVLATVVFTLAVGYVLFAAWVFQLVWNWLIHDYFGGPHLSLWMGLAVIFVLSLLAGTIRGGK